MIETRKIHSISMSQSTMEGAGVHLQRAFGFHDEGQFDPFLLLDDFRSDNPAFYLKGFPWHPHRGIETITYVLEGDVEHSDSLGNRGVISSGDVQWMTAGSGIIHQEMPKSGEQGRMGGFQLWANLPRAQKMMDPRYRDVKNNEIPEVTLEGGVKVRVICGEAGGVKGPVQDIIIDPEYLDISLPAGSRFEHPTQRGHNVFAYVIGGGGHFSAAEEPLVNNGNLVLFEDGDLVQASSAAEGLRFLLISGKPIREPVAWAGPIVMNTEEELETAFEEYRNGTFIKHG